MNVVSTYLPWLLSAITIYMTVLAGNKSRHAWLVGLFNQALWLIWIISTSAWGLLPMNLALWIVYSRNHLKWSKPAPEPSPFLGGIDRNPSPYWKNRVYQPDIPIEELREKLNEFYEAAKRENNDQRLTE